jgi:hypothetical protein
MLFVNEIIFLYVNKYFWSLLTSQFALWCLTHILLCFCLFFLILYIIYCQFLWTLHYLLPLRYSLTFIMHTVSFQRWNNCVVTSRRFLKLVQINVYIWRQCTYIVYVGSVRVITHLPVSLNLALFIAPSVFSNLYYAHGFISTLKQLCCSVAAIFSVLKWRCLSAHLNLI